MAREKVWNSIGIIQDDVGDDYDYDINHHNNDYHHCYDDDDHLNYENYDNHYNCDDHFQPTQNANKTMPKMKKAIVGPALVASRGDMEGKTVKNVEGNNNKKLLQMFVKHRMIEPSHQSYQHSINNYNKNGSTTVGKTTSSTRASKTLEWYMKDKDKVFFARSDDRTKEKQCKTDAPQFSSQSSSPAYPRNHQGAFCAPVDTLEARKMAKSSGHNKSTTAPIELTATSVDDDRKRRRRQRINKKAPNCKPGAASDNNGKTSASNHGMGMNRSPNDTKDSYWYYDPKTDGFYYDLKGSRGWRRRAPVSAMNSRNTMSSFDNKGSAYPSPWCDYTHLHHQTAFDAFPLGRYSANYAPHIQYYDPETDGYYFEMPSVDGWKRRQQTCDDSLAQLAITDRSMLHHDSAINIAGHDCSFALENLPSKNGVNNSCFKNSTAMVNASTAKEAFSSGESSFSTMSSSGDSSSPMLRSDFSDRANSFLAEEVNSACCTNKNYDEISELFLDNKSSDGMRKLDEERIESLFCMLNKKPYSYADVVATNGSFENTENSPPVNDISKRRPSSLKIPNSYSFGARLEDGLKGLKRLELTNFNADKFIADLPFNSTERVLRDLAALKTPCSGPQACSIDSPHTPAVMKDLPPSVTPNETDAFCSWYDMEEMLSQILSHNEEKWAANSSAGTTTTSKLSFWCNSGVIAGIAKISCDD